MIPADHHDRRVLFLDQGRATKIAGMGHIRVQHALAAGLDAAESSIEPMFASVPAATIGQRLFSFRRYASSWTFGSVRWHLARSWAARRLITQQLRTVPPDVVHLTTDQVSFLLGRLHRRVPHVLSLDSLIIDWVHQQRGLPLDPFNSPLHLAPIAVLERRALQRAALVVAWTETVLDRVQTLAPASRVVCLHPGLDLAPFRRRDARGPRPPGPMRVLFIGGRWQEKGGPLLLDALGPELGSSVELDVVTTEDVAVTNGVTVHRAQPGSNVIADLLSRADVLALPTSSDACPWVVLEAMASGVPVVSTPVGSIPEMLNAGGSDPGGVVTPVGDVEALREALFSLFDDHARRQAMAGAGQARVAARYDAKVNTPRLVELLGHAAGDAARV